MNTISDFDRETKVVLNVIVLYVLLSGIWVLFSDIILGWFASDIVLYRRLQSYKGLAFIFVTAVLFLLYVRPRIEALNRSQQALLSTEKELLEQYKLIEKITDTSPLGIIVADAKGNITFANKAAEGMLGLTKDENGNLLSDNPDKYLSFLKNIAFNEKISDLRHKAELPDGSNLLLSINSVPLDTDSEEIAGAVVTLTNITKHKHTEEELKRRLDYELATVKCMRLLLEPASIDQILPRILEIVHCSVGNSRTYVFQNEEDPELGLCMSQLYEVVADGITQEIDNPRLKHLPYSEGAPSLLVALHSRQSYAHVVAELDGVERTILEEQGILSILILPIYCGQELWGFVGFDDCETVRQWNEDDINLLWVVANGIGEAILRKRSEDALKESEERFKALHNASFGGIGIHDKGIILDCNQGLSEITGYPLEELIGMNGLLLIAEGFRDTVMNNILSGFEEPYEVIGLHKDGTEYPLRVESKNIPYKGKMVRVTEFRDITEQKKAEHSLIEAKLMAEENSRIKSEFLANMSHELRTPLAAILGFSEMLYSGKFGELNEKQLNFTDHIHKGGEHLLELINDILDLSKIEAGKMELECEMFSVEEAFKEIQTSIAPLATKRNIDLILENKIRGSEIVADKLKFKQIMYNLLSNAIKFTPENGRVKVAANKSNNVVVVSVSDTGIGIPENRIRDIFNPFTQVDASNRRKYGGTGLGLALVKKFVEMQNGSIRVESEEGKGSTFTFTIADQSYNMNTSESSEV